MTIVELDLLVKAAGLFGLEVVGGYIARPDVETFYTIKVENDILTFFRCISLVKKTNSIRPNIKRTYKVMLADADPKEIAKALVKYMNRYNYLKKKQANEQELRNIAKEFED
jgi:hypothetical protein